MMCLGWTNKPHCAARDDAQVVPPCAPAVVVGPGTVGTACPDIMWFWVSAAVVAVGAVLKKGGRSN